MGFKKRGQRPGWLRSGLGALLWVWGFLLFAQTPRRWADHQPPPAFERLGLAQGLSHSTVHAILQDRQGFMWFGTEDGLDRYDGSGMRSFRHDRKDQGSLSANFVTCLFEDRLGRMWVGTQSGGLNRYDPNLERMIRFPAWAGRDPGHSLNSMGINALAEDREGRLWVGTSGGGLSRLDQEKDETGKAAFTSFLPTSPLPLPGRTVNALLRDHRGDLWVGLEDGGLVRTVGSGNDLRFEPLPLVLPTNITALAEDALGVLWIGSPEGLWTLAPDRRQARAFPPEAHSRVLRGVVRTLHRDTRGGIWIGLDGGGLLRPDRPWSPKGPMGFRTFRHEPDNPESLGGDAIEAIYEDRSSVLWTSVYQGGLQRLVLRPEPGFNRDRRRFSIYDARPLQPGSLSGRIVNATLEDSKGRLWVGTDGQGLNLAVPGAPGEPLRFQSIRARPGVAGALQDDVVTCLMEDREGQIWVGTYSAGLARMEVPAGGGLPRFTHFRSRRGDTRSLLSDFVLSLAQDPAGRFWVGTVNGGLHQFHPQTGTFTRHPFQDERPGTLSDPSVICLAPDSHGTLWVGTVDGLNRFDPATGIFRVYQSSDGLKGLHSRFIRSLRVDGRGALWIGTNDGGLSMTQPLPWQAGDPVFHHFGAEAGIPSGQILDILEDTTGRLWLGNIQGLFRFDPATGKGRPVSIGSGGFSFEVNRNAGLRTRSGDLIFGGHHGIVFFRPDELLDHPLPPRTVLVDFQLFNRSVPIGATRERRTLLTQAITQTRELELTAREAIVSFTFGALHFADPGRNTFAYKLEGLDQDWNQAGTRRFVTYTTLPPGTYTLKVKAANADGVWGEPDVNLTLRILPPFWRRPLFLALAGIALAGAILGIHWLRVRVLRRSEARLQRLVAERTQALESANRELENLARKDGLTGLANARHFHESLHQAVAMAIREGRRVGVILMDVDHFKKYNDSLGHPAGDQCLRELGKLLADRVRRVGDLPARYGGEEFAILLLGANEQATYHVAEEIRQSILGAAIPHPDSQTNPLVTASFGCASVQPGLGFKAEDLLMRADLALYQAKRTGRNRSEIADPSQTW